MRRLLHRLIALTLVLAPLAVLPRTPAGAAARQTVAVAAIMAQMTPAEKVGQLFLVSAVAKVVNAWTPRRLAPGPPEDPTAEG